MVGSEYPLDREYSFVFSLSTEFFALKHNIIIDLGAGVVDKLLCTFGPSVSMMNNLDCRWLES